MIIAGNLDYETQLARSRGIHIELPRGVRRMLAALSTLMAALADDGDELRTIEPVDPERMTSPLLAAVELAHDPNVPDDGIAWGRLDAGAWNDRRYDYALGQRLASAHPGTTLLASVDALEDHLSAGGAGAGAEGAWVLKAPLSASGRYRLRQRGDELEPAARTRAARLFAQFGELLFEPWVERTRDVGCCGFVDAVGVSIRAPHRLLVDRAGVFRGIDLTPAEDAEAVSATAERVGAELLAAGYRGPFGVDAYWYRNAEREVLRPFCELNARYSFGHLAWSLSERAGQLIALHVGRGAPPDATHALLVPADDEPTSAWWSAACS